MGIRPSQKWCKLKELLGRWVIGLFFYLFIQIFSEWLIDSLIEYICEWVIHWPILPGRYISLLTANNLHSPLNSDQWKTPRHPTNIISWSSPHNSFLVISSAQLNWLRISCFFDFLFSENTRNTLWELKNLYLIYEVYCYLIPHSTPVWTSNYNLLLWRATIPFFIVVVKAALQPHGWLGLFHHNNIYQHEPFMRKFRVS